MNPKTKVVGIIAAIVVVGLAGYGLAKLFQGPTTIVQTTQSPSGVTFNTAKLAATNMTPTTNSATSSSALFNSDSSDRIVTDGFITCSGVSTVFGLTSSGVDAWHWYLATSSVPVPTTSIANSLLAAMNVTVATSSTQAYTSTTTYTSPFARRWNSGTYLVAQTNATSSAAACTVGVHYLGT